MGNDGDRAPTTSLCQVIAGGRREIKIRTARTSRNRCPIKMEVKNPEPEPVYGMDQVAVLHLE
jgi:hypothetical protein